MEGGIPSTCAAALGAPGSWDSGILGFPSMDLGVVQPSQGRGLTPSVPLLSHKSPSEQI